MLRTLIEKECRFVLLSPRFLGIFAVSAVLMLLSVFIGTGDFRDFEDRQSSARQLLAEEHAQATSWMDLTQKVFRDPDPVQIFATGVHNDVGRLSLVGTMSEAKLKQSVYSDDPIYAVFRFLDLTFIVQIVLSLFAIVMTYDSISGERESGTLQLTLANAVPRARYLVAKLVGRWIGLIVPLVVPLLLALFAVTLSGVPFELEHWIRLALLLIGALLYLTFFVGLGVAVSASTRSSSASFLMLLVGWIVLVLAVPRAGVLAAVEMVSVPSVAEVESTKEGYERREWEDYRQQLMERWNDRQLEIESQPTDAQMAYEDSNSWQWMEEDDEQRRALLERIVDNGRNLDQELRNRKVAQERLGLALSRVSPASAFQLVALEAAGTGLGLRQRYQQAIDGYRSRMIEYMKDKDAHGMVFRRRGGSGGGDGSSMGRSQPLDLRDLPRFEPPRLILGESLPSIALDFTLLILASLLCVAVAWVRFLGYDPRPG